MHGGSSSSLSIHRGSHPDECWELGVGGAFFLFHMVVLAMYGHEIGLARVPRFGFGFESSSPRVPLCSSPPACTHDIVLMSSRAMTLCAVPIAVLSYNKTMRWHGYSLTNHYTTS